MTFRRTFKTPPQFGATIGVIIFMIALASTVQAQRFQWFYGPVTPVPGAGTSGQNGVEQCNGWGYISAGTTRDSAGAVGDPVAAQYTATQNIYVLRSDSRGAPMWQRRIDFYTSMHTPLPPYSFMDSGTCVRECANGDFIIAGFTLSPHIPSSPGAAFITRNIFLIRMDLNGNVLWAKLYGHEFIGDGGDLSEERAFDVIETTTGPTTGRCRKGDFIIAGYRQNISDPSTPSHAILYRIRENGNAVWQNTYRINGTGNERFHAVAECSYGVHPDSLSDLVAVGQTDAYSNTTDAWIVRVDPKTGGFSGGDHGSVAIDGGGDEIFYAVDQLTISANAGNIVAAGTTTSRPYPSTSNEVFVIEAQPNPSLPLVANRVYGDNGSGEDIGYGIKEITIASLNPGNVVVCGQATLPFGWGAGSGFGWEDGFIQEMAPGALSMVGSMAVHGDTTPNRFYSVNEVEAVPTSIPATTPGFILCGSSLGRGTIPPPPFLPPYHWLVKTDANKLSYCNSMEREVSDDEIELETYDEEPPYTAESGTWEPEYLVYSENWGEEGCFVPYKRTTRHDRNGISIISDDGSGSSVANISPNPLQEGESFNLGFTAATGGVASVVVSDIRGAVLKKIAHEHGQGNVQLAIDTKGWPAGTYAVQIEVDGRVISTRVVIID